MIVAELIAVMGLRVDKESFKAASNAMRTLRAAALGFLSISVGKKLIGWAEEAAEAGTHVVGLSHQLGISTQAVQEWGFVAKQSGSNMNEFAVAVSQVERNMRLFAEGKGSKEVRRTFQEFGLTQSQVAADLKKPNGLNDTLFTIADRMKAMGVTAESSSAITMVAGRRAKGFAADMAQGSAALRKQIDDAHRLGMIQDDKTLNNLKALDNNVKKLEGAWHGLFMQVIGQLAPQLSKMLEKATAWIIENKDLIQGAMTTAVHVLSAAFRMLATAVELVAKFVRGIFSGDKNAILLFSFLGAIIISVVVPAVWALVSAFVAWAAAMATNPVILILTLIILAVMLLRKHWDEVTAFIAGSFLYLKQMGENFWNWLTDKAESVGNKIVDMYHDVRDAIVGVFHKIAELPIIKQVIEAINWLRGSDGGGKGGGGKGSEGPGTWSRIAGWAGDALGFATGQGSALGHIDTSHISTTTPWAPTTGALAGVGGAGARGGTNHTEVSVAPTTVNIYGVQGAAGAKEEIGDAIDQRNRHAAAALGGTVR